MRIYTKAGDLAFSTFTFPDGQPHFKLETYEREFSSVTVEMALKSPSELFTLAMAVGVLRANGYSEVCLDIRYLLGARMDRAISVSEPFTLELVARFINSLGLSRVRILDVHSEVATRLIRNSENVLPHSIVRQVYQTLIKSNLLTVCPDKGARDRVDNLARSETVYCEKERDLETGKLSGFKVLDSSTVADHECLIIDDICDGGGTFVGLAKELRKVGAKKIYLYVTHGIFSKGAPLEWIDHIYTTNSYHEDYVGKYPGVTFIPISMKEL
jgi:ribose-phosphate pyrophosphokinase